MLPIKLACEFDCSSAASCRYPGCVNPTFVQWVSGENSCFFFFLPAGLRAPAAAGTYPAGRRLLGQNSEGVPTDETHAGSQSDHGGAAEVPTMPHRRKTVGHVSVCLADGQ